MATRTFVAPLRARDQWVHHRCPCNTPKRASRRRSLRFEQRTLLYLSVQQRTHLLSPTLNGRMISLIRLPQILAKLSHRPHKLRVRRQLGSII